MVQRTEIDQYAVYALLEALASRPMRNDELNSEEHILHLFNILCHRHVVYAVGN